MNAVLVKGDAVGATLYYGARRRRRADRLRGGGRPGGRDAHAYRRPAPPRAASGVPARPAGRYADPADGRGAHRVLPAPARVRPARRAGRHHPHPGRLHISIDAMVQKEPAEGEEQVDIILLTHITVEKNINAAIAKIEALRYDGRQGDAHPPGRTGGQVIRSDMNYLSTRGGCRRNSASPKSCSAGCASDGGLYRAGSLSALQRRRTRRDARHELPRTGLRRAVALCSTTFPHDDLRAHDRQDLHRRRLSLHHPARTPTTSPR